LLRDGGEREFTMTEWSPPVDIAEDDKEYTVKAELPGMNKEDIKVTVEGGVLSIAGERMPVLGINDEDLEPKLKNNAELIC
jgi:HSP20 family protein